MRSWAVCIVIVCIWTTAHDAPLAQTATESQRSGAEIYRAACAACHGDDGRGRQRTSVGFAVPLPDFTDCRFASPEADADWLAVAHEGGPVRAFDPLMPAFGDALAENELRLAVSHVRSFCAEPGWPRGDLNLPRPLVTEKAFPENEAVLTTSIVDGGSGIVSEFLYEHRIGRRGQYELSVPIAAREGSSGSWSAGLGDVAIAYKHAVFDSVRRGSIVSAGAELIVPTGKESAGIGSGHAVFEPFATISQVLPNDLFLHVHAGLELPVRGEANDEAFWRLAIGRTIAQGRWHRTWSPIVEALGSRELGTDDPLRWDVVPQLQISLSTRQHILLNGGVRLPVTDRRSRGPVVLVYLLWDWFDGGLFDGW